MLQFASINPPHPPSIPLPPRSSPGNILLPNSKHLVSPPAQTCLHTGECVVVSACGRKKNFLYLNQDVEKTSLLRQEALLTQWVNFLIIRESCLWPHGRVCFYSPETKECGEWSCHTLVDLLTGWGRRSLLILLLVGWAHMLPP